MLVVMLGMVPQACAQPPAARARRSVMLVRVPAKPCWQDMAFLAAVPAAAVANDGKPAVIALGEAGDIPREIEDYLRRYKPGVVYLLGSPAAKAPSGARSYRAMQADSADAAACILARTFWRSSAAAVLCPDDDYASALVGAALAARLRAPLLFSGKDGLSAAARETLKRLGPRQAVLVGRAAKAAATLKKQRLAVTELADAKAVLAWMRTRRLAASYLAAVNPKDRSRTVIRKLSLAAPLLAAARDGMVVPLAYETRWKVGFSGTECPKDRNQPRGVPEGKRPPRVGRIRLDGQDVPFVVTGDPRGRCRLNLDLNANGAYNDAGEGPFAIADTVTLGKKRYAVTLGQKNGVGKADVRLTWPTAARVQRDLRACYKVIGRHPEHLCIVGFPDAIPQAIVRKDAGSPGDLTSDLPYSNVDDDLFAEIAVARLIAENASFATLHAARVITYEQLLDASWQRNVGQARWENTYARLFENVGFRTPFRHDRGDLKWLVKPVKPARGTKGVKGKRAREFGQDSPLTRTAAITHMAHSFWKDLGQTFSWDSSALLAPVVVESGGCLTAALDRQGDYRSVIARLFRNGAVSFVGNARPGIACQEQLRLEFWNGVLAGKTIGQAHRMALNSTAVTVLETNQLDRGGDRYELYIRTLFGDPAFRMHVPSAPKSAPAKVTVKGNVVSVHAPAAWWPVKIRVPEDWKKWNDKDLYVCRGAGTYALRHWCGQGYDREVTCLNAEIRTKRRIRRIEQVQSPPKPLGWRGKHFVDEHADGTRTYRWRVQLIDFDQIKGKILAKVARIDYRIEWQ